ncbi:MAG: hypothetical protein R6V55_08450 [Desulfovermiculus sp.]
MSDATSQVSRYERLQGLLSLLTAERKAAKDLDVMNMDRVTEAKEELLQTLQNETQPLLPEEEILIGHIRHELKRNAFFFEQALAWVQESVQVVRGQEESTAYSAAGSMVGTNREGRLLSGRI